MKTILLILLALTITTLNLKAEKLTGNARLDSLIADLPNAQGDTNEVKLLSSISFGFRSTNPDKGIEYGEQGLALAKKMNWKRGQAKALNSIGVNYAVQNNYSKAFDYYYKSFDTYKKIGDKFEMAWRYNNIGLIHYAKKDFDKYFTYTDSAISLLEDIEANESLVKILSTKGQIYNSISQYDNAKETYLKALELMDEDINKKLKASLFKSTGRTLTNLSEYEVAQEYFDEALIIYKKLNDSTNIASLYISLGVNHDYRSHFPEALSYYKKSLEIGEKLGNKRIIATNISNIGGIYAQTDNHQKAIEYFFKAIKLAFEIKDTMKVAINYGYLGSNYNSLNKDSVAMYYYQKALKISRRFGNKKREKMNLNGIASLNRKRGDYKTALKYSFKVLEISEKLLGKWDLANNYAFIGNTYYLMAKDTTKSGRENSSFKNINKDLNLDNAISYLTKAIYLFEEIDELDIRSRNINILSRCYEIKGDYKMANGLLKEYHKLKDSVFSQENSDKIAAIEKAREDDLKQKEIEKQKIRIAEQEKREKLIFYFLVSLVVIMTVVMIVIYRLLKRSDKLLYNVLPVSIAKRLKKKEHPISDYFTQASIVFIDIVNFTELSKDEDPRRVVEALNKIFTKYDTISNKYGLEKIKTIGDSYMAAAGIPEVQKDNTHRAAQMALEVKAMMQDYHTADGTKIEVRIGLDCGPVVAGVIGENKFIYDMWSDAVNTASRMESSSIAGEVHVSERFKDAVTEYEEFSYVERGEIEIKGKGKMKTFFMG